MLFRVHYVVEALVESSIRRRKMDGLSKSCVMAVSHIRGLGEMKYTLTTILAFSWFSRNSEVENPHETFRTKIEESMPRSIRFYDSGFLHIIQPLHI